MACSVTALLDFTGVLSSVIKQMGREVNHSQQSSAELTNEWGNTYTLPYVCIGLVLR